MPAIVEAEYTPPKKIKQTKNEPRSQTSNQMAQKHTARIHNINTSDQQLKYQVQLKPKNKNDRAQHILK